MFRIEKTGHHGLYFPDLGIALDGSHPDAAATFVSHAHADHIPYNRKVTVHATPATLDLMKERGFRGKELPVDFGRKLTLEKAEVTLWPAGHILGSAMISIESNAGSLLYTGDYRTPPSPVSEGFDSPESADFLITEATFGLPIYKWKSHDQLAEEVRLFATDALRDGYTPIFLGYNLGKAQEIMHMLAPLDREIMIHGAGYKLCKVYNKYGFHLGNYSAYDREQCEGKLLVAPSSALSSGFASNVKRKRIAYCSGWAADESRRSQLSADALIPLSDHLDFFELIRFCKKIQPRKVMITHTPNPDVVQHYLTLEGLESEGLHFQIRQED
ncbi:MAG: hypothetical protein EA360_06895 [Balneolaceae bacterium]|nr:MAG: hypothetical protein EA360_06895 [Balneolaceae bacterium]